MSTCILKFNREEDHDEMTLALKGGDYYLTLFDFDNYLRGVVKYNGDNYPEEVVDTYDKIREKLYEIMSEHKVSLGDIS